MNSLRWYFLILTSLSCGLGSDDSDCVLRQGPHTTAIHCKSGNSSFGISIGLIPNQILVIRCEKTLNFSGFEFERIENFQISEYVNSESCQLPDSKQIGFIVRNLQLNDIKRLTLESLNMEMGLNLSRNIVRDFKGIDTLFLIRNNFSDISSDHLEEFHLRHLTLALNNLEELSKDFLILPNLQLLEIRSNGLEVINSKTFSPLNKTHASGILEKKLDQIEPNLFDKLVSLTHLIIQCEKLQTLPANIFTSLRNLITLSLEGNNFSHELLDSNLLQNHNKLRTLRFGKNKQKLITLPNRFLANMTNLQEVFMNENGLVTLPEDLFYGTTSLEELDMKNNDIKSIPAHLLKDCEGLTWLNFENNQIDVLPDGIFSNQKKLFSLNLSKNRIKTISSSTFSGLYSLKRLDMEMNNLETIEFGPWLYNIEMINFSHNNLTFQNYTSYNHSPFPQIEIKGLDFGYNHISHMVDDWFQFTKLESLNLDHNEFEEISSSDLKFMSEGVSIHLTYNKIKEISMDIEDIKKLNSSGSELNDINIDVNNNPIACDCEFYDLLYNRDRYTYFSIQNPFRFYGIPSECREPSRLNNTRFSFLDFDDLKCLISKPEIIDATCPDKCECWMRPSNEAYIIDCSNRGLDRAPEQIKAPAEHHIELNLTGNFLTSMPSLSQPGYDKVTDLLLANNNIDNVPLQSLSRKLKILELHNNKLTKLDTPVLKYLGSYEHFFRVSLQGNPWECTCEQIESLEFFQAMRKATPDLQLATCAEMKEIIRLKSLEVYCVEL